MASQLVWLITGTSSGLGRDLTIAALKRGDKVIATGRGRSVSKLEDLRAHGADVLELDVTSPLETLHEIAKRAAAIHGRIDVVVNNAGYILVGAIEESTCVPQFIENDGIDDTLRPEESYEQFNTNVFGALNVTRAFLPYMREKRSGTIAFIGSLWGWRSAPNAGLYAATKFTLRGISATLNEEISPLGLRSTCIDFGYFRTSFLTADHRAPPVSRIADYKAMMEESEAALHAYNGKQPGDPTKGVEVILDVVRGEGAAEGKVFPTSLSLGSDCYGAVRDACESTLKGLEKWGEVSKSTDFAWVKDVEDPENARQ